MAGDRTYGEEMDTAHEQGKAQEAEKDAENSVRPTSRTQQLEFDGVTNAGLPGAKDTGKAPGEDPEDLPPYVNKTFIRVDFEFYFQNREPAFSFKNDELRAKATTPEVVRAFVEVAKHKEWKSITVSGTKDFRRAVWFEAASQGLEVKGYKPTEVEKAQVEQLKKDRGLSEPEPEQENIVTKDGVERERKPAQVKAQVRDGSTRGMLIDYGPAKYQHNPEKENSYFAKILTENGEKTVWGVGIEQAISDSGVEVGDSISLKRMGKEPVTVKEKIFDSAGNKIGEKDVDTHRNRWEAELLERAPEALPERQADRGQALGEQFLKGDKQDVLKRHPELARAYAGIAVAEKYARSIMDDKKQIESFVSKVASRYAKIIDKGGPIPGPTVKKSTLDRILAEQEKNKVQGRERNDLPERPRPEQPLPMQQPTRARREQKTPER